MTTIEVSFSIEEGGFISSKINAQLSIAKRGDQWIAQNDCQVNMPIGKGLIAESAIADYIKQWYERKLK